MKYELYVVTDPDLSLGRAQSEVVAQAVTGGATVIQLRDKKANDRELIATGLLLREITRHAGATFIVNDRVDVALAVDADGVHLGEADMPLPLARKLMGREKLIGFSPSTPQAAVQAEQEGADYLGIGAVFATNTKTDIGAPVGLDALRVIRSMVSIPLVAIGGIKADNAAQVIQAGADGVAVVSAVVSAPDIAAAARELREIVEEAKQQQ